MQLLTGLLLILFIYGCGPVATKSSVTTNDPEIQANNLLRTGDYGHAAEEFLRLSELYPNKTVYYQLKAAAAYLDANATSQAGALLDITDVTPGDINNNAFKKLLLARTALQKNQPDIALSLLSMPFNEKTSSDLLTDRHNVIASAYLAQNRYMDAVEERLTIADYLSDSKLKDNNYLQLWDDINHINLTDLKNYRNTAGSDLNSWIELAIINQSMLFKPDILEQAINSWCDFYPKHPAIPLITDRLLQFSKQYVLRPQNIALLLPFTGQYKKASEAIRDGFLTAWFNSDEYKPATRIYNTDSLNIRDIYQKAVQNGADFVVGPLEKQAVQILAESGNLDVTTLALNQQDQTETEHSGKDLYSDIPRLIQFGLAPEDEARQIAQKAFFDGHTKALVLIPDNDWGLRLYRAFQEEWNGFGGEILELVQYGSRTNDYLTPVKKLLNIDTSMQRTNQLRQILSRRLSSEPRLREDADMIFMAAQPVSARQIVPQLRFFRAENIAVYASSHVYSGIINTQTDSDMNNVMFTDIPWLLDHNQEASVLYQTIERNWLAENSGFSRLYALGIDAFMLIPQLGRLAFERKASFSGQTGQLSMTDGSRIVRKLLWGKFINGRPVLMDQGAFH